MISLYKLYMLDYLGLYIYNIYLYIYLDEMISLYKLYMLDYLGLYIYALLHLVSAQNSRKKLLYTICRDTVHL